MPECAGKYDEWIVDDLAGELDDERREELASHLAECPTCSALRRESQRVIELYRLIPGDEPGGAVEAVVRERAFAGDAPPGAVAQVAPAPSRARWLALAAMVIFALGAGVGYGVFYLRAQAEQDQLRADHAAETMRVKQEAEAVFEEAAAAAAKAARLAEEAEVEARQLEGSLEEKEALARAKKLAEEADAAKAEAKRAAGKADKAAGAKRKATGKGGGKKKNGLADDPLGADYEL